MRKPTKTQPPRAPKVITTALRHVTGGGRTAPAPNIPPLPSVLERDDQLLD